MKYSVLSIKGKQYKASEGDALLVDKMDEKEDIKVLLSCDGDTVKIGKPYLTGVKVEYKKNEDVKGKKIDVFKYKSKSRYRKHTGFRSIMTPIVIEKISS